MSKEHEDLTSIHPFAFVDDSDPGAVGADKGWIDTDHQIPELKYRNGDNDDWVSLTGGTDSVRLLQKTVWPLADAPFTIFNMPAGKNMLLDKIVIVALTDLTSTMAGSELSFVDSVTSYSLLFSLDSSQQWDKFNRGAGMNFGGVVTFTSFYDGNVYHDFPVIGGDLVTGVSPSTIAVDEVLVFIYGTLIDPVY